MTALICGSIAYDTIMVFDGHFKESILPDKIHMLNVAFLVPELRREFGGCGGNIAYNLKMLGGDPLLMAVVGHDFGPYARWMDRHNISRRHIRELDEEFTAQAYITTDLDDNQITAFHPGAMNCSHRNVVPADEGIGIGIIAPDGREAMVTHADQFHSAGIPFIFDPGQGLPMFDGQELLDFVDKASWVAVNDYEAQMLQNRTSLSQSEIAARVDALIVTRGAEGSVIHAGGHCHEIPAAPVNAVRDPTGCGDAYRAGLLYGLARGFDWATTGRIASLMGAIKIECHGTQNHSFDAAAFAQRFTAAFGTAMPA